MKTKKSLLLIAISLFLSVSLFGGATSYTSLDADIFDDSGAAVSDGLAVLGYFDSGFSVDPGSFTLDTYGSLVTDGNFMVLDSTSIFVSGYTQFNGSYDTPNDDIAGLQLAVWLFNVADPLNATTYDMALFSDSSWLGTGSGTTDIIAYDISDNDGADLLFGGFDGSGTFPIVTLNTPAAVIPEPSTYLLLLGGMGLLFFIRRRK